MSMGFGERPPAREMAAQLADRASVRAASAKLAQGGTSRSGRSGRRRRCRSMIFGSRMRSPSRRVLQVPTRRSEPGAVPYLSRAVAVGRLSRLFPMKRHCQVRLDDGSDVARPHHRSVTAEVDDFAIGAVEVTRSARVAPDSNSQAVMAGIEWSLGRLAALDAGDDLTVQCDVERSTSKLYPDPFSDQPERCWHSGLLPFGPRGAGEKASTKLHRLQHRLRRRMGCHPGSSRRSRREGKAAQNPPRLRWLVDGMDVGHDRSILLSVSEVATTMAS